MTRMNRAFQWALLAMSIAFTVGCASERIRGYGTTYDAASATGIAASRSVASRAIDGPTIAQHLQERYDDSQMDCRGLPALLCSGILMRATRRGPGYDAWNPNPSNAQPNGVSFSWLRRDSGFNRLAYGLSDGFIVLPYFFADDAADHFTQLQVLCAFAFDAGTDNRRSIANDGCGAYPGYANSGPCQAQGVSDATAWLAKFENSTSRYQSQCGFTLTAGMTGASQSFASIMTIRKRLASSAIDLQNEVKISTWAQNDPRLPLEAFFSIGTTGLAAAKENQADFKRATGRWVPVIRITLPQSSGGAAGFIYNESDQSAR